MKINTFPKKNVDSHFPFFIANSTLGITHIWNVKQTIEDWVSTHTRTQSIKLSLWSYCINLDPCSQNICATADIPLGIQTYSNYLIYVITQFHNKSVSLCVCCCCCHCPYPDPCPFPCLHPCRTTDVVIKWTK